MIVSPLLVVFHSRPKESVSERQDLSSVSKWSPGITITSHVSSVTSYRCFKRGKKIHLTILYFIHHPDSNDKQLIFITINYNMRKLYNSNIEHNIYTDCNKRRLLWCSLSSLPAGWQLQIHTTHNDSRFPHNKLLQSYDNDILNV